MWVAGNMSSREYFGMPVKQIRRKVFYLGALGIPSVLLLISAGVVLRAGGASAAQIGQSVIGERTKNYMCGHIGALSQWLDNADLVHIRPSFGKFSVAGPYEAISGDMRAGGIMPDVAILATGQTNVYTYFRQLVEDFTLLGSLIAMGVLALLWGIAYRRAREHSRFWTGVLATCYCGVLLVLTSIFNYNSMIVAVMLYGTWWWSPWRARKGLAWAQQAF